MAALIIKKPVSKHVQFHTIEIGTVFSIDDHDDDVYMKIHPVEGAVEGQIDLEMLYNAVSLVDFHTYEIDGRDDVLVCDAELNLKPA
jgi:hypothetical protein